MISNETKGIVRGEYGKTPAPISDEIRKMIIGDEKPITCRPADNIPKELDKYREEMKQYLEQEEDVLSYALFGQVAVKFFKERQAKKYKVDSSLADTKNNTYPV